MFKNKNFIPWLIAAIAVIAAIAISISSVTRVAKRTDVTDSVVVTTVNVTESVDTSGYINALSTASLAWKTSGIVEVIKVKVGDHVKAGEVLMSLQPTSTAANIIAAQADLINAQNQLNDLQYPDGEAIAAAQKTLASAYAVWDQSRLDLSSALSGTVSNGDSKQYNDLTSAETDLKDALAAYALVAKPEAQWYYWAARQEALNRTGDYDFTALTASLRKTLNSDDADWIDDIVTTQQKYETAVKDFAESVADYATAVTVNNAVAAYQQSAETLLSASQRAYETLVAPNPKSLAIARAHVDSAQASVVSLNIIAPFDGEVLVIEQHLGDVVSIGMVALSLADRSNLYIDAQIDEADIAQVAMGNPVAITLDAMPGATLNGTVTYINPMGKTISGLIKYNVRVDLASVKDPLLLGATADVTIQVRDAQPALAVPASAVQSDKAGEYVTVIATDGSLRRVTIQSGGSVGELVIISGDLQAGDRVQSKYQNGVQAPNPFGGN